MWEKLLKKFLLISLLAVFGSLAAYAATPTRFNYLEVKHDCTVDGNLTVDGSFLAGSCSCTNISTATINTGDVNATYGVTGATAAISGLGTFGSVATSTATLSGSQALRFPANYINAATTVPAAANIIGIDSSHDVYISTGTGAGAWVKVGGP